MTTILVIEPDNATAQSLSSSLGSPNYSVDVVDSASAAIEWADAQTADFIIIDLDLPDLGPIALLAALEARAGHTLIRFYVSRTHGTSVRFRGAPVLIAPFEPIGVRATLAEAVIEHDLRQANDVNL